MRWIPTSGGFATSSGSRAGRGRVSVVVATLAVVMSAGTSAAAGPILLGVFFDQDPLGTTYGPPTHAPGDVALSVFGIDVRVREFTLDGSTQFGAATVGGFAGSAFNATPISLSNIRLDFDATGFFTDGYDKAWFEFADFGGSKNLVVNGDAAEFDSFAAPAMLGGVSVTVDPRSDVDGATRGTVILEGEPGSIQSLQIGGQELGIVSVTLGAAFGWGIAGDHDATGQVEQGDLDLVLNNWGVDTDAAGVPVGWEGDQPQGVIDQGELDAVLSNWASVAVPAFRGSNHPGVPEPAAAWMFAALAPSGARRGRRNNERRRFDAARGLA